jgi:hypothetical protein
MTKITKRQNETVYQGDTPVCDVTVEIEVQTVRRQNDEVALDLAEDLRAAIKQEVQGTQDKMDTDGDGR